MPKNIAVILGGGKGSRLYPLTKDRSKPAVPIGGKYRLIDIPISNCVNSQIYSIYIVTQFNSASLNKHIKNAYRFDHFHEGFVDILAAEQSNESSDWYQGTADAVRKNLRHILSYPDVETVLILSGDQIYSMDYRKLYKFHEDNNCEITISAIPVTEEETKGFGILRLEGMHITSFLGKPQTAEERAGYAHPTLISRTFPGIARDKEYLASMGIYLFSREALLKVLDGPFEDFGGEIIPEAIKNMRVGCYLFHGYWEDVGTIASFLDANIDFATAEGRFDFFSNFIYTNSRFLPASRLVESCIDQSLIAEGSRLTGATVKRSVIGVRSVISKGAVIEDSVVMGNDFFETPEEAAEKARQKIPGIGIGEGTVVRRAIIDKNARVGKNCRIVNEAKVEEMDGPNYCIRSGIVIIPKNSRIPDSTVI